MFTVGRICDKVGFEHCGFESTVKKVRVLDGESGDDGRDPVYMRRV